MQQPEAVRHVERRGEREVAPEVTWCPECARARHGEREVTPEATWAEARYPTRLMHRRGRMVHATPLAVVLLAVVPFLLAFAVGFFGTRAVRR